MFEVDKDTLKIMTIFKTIIDKRSIADTLAEETVKTGIKLQSKILEHYYGKDEPQFITMSCISFGLIQFMEEDFYIVKEILGYNYVMQLLQQQKRYLSVI